jgi:hypothetical protein
MAHHTFQGKSYALHTAHCTLHAAHCTLRTTHYTLRAAHCTLHTAHCTMHADMAQISFPKHRIPKFHNASDMPLPPAETCLRGTTNWAAPSLSTGSPQCSGSGSRSCHTGSGQRVRGLARGGPTTSWGSFQKLLALCADLLHAMTFRQPVYASVKRAAY